MPKETNQIRRGGNGEIFATEYFSYIMVAKKMLFCNREFNIIQSVVSSGCFGLALCYALPVEGVWAAKPSCNRSVSPALLNIVSVASQPTRGLPSACRALKLASFPDHTFPGPAQGRSTKSCERIACAKAWSHAFSACVRASVFPPPQLKRRLQKYTPASP